MEWKEFGNVEEIKNNCAILETTKRSENVSKTNKHDQRGH